MILSRDEAISLVLYLSRNHEINSQTKLNKLLARLNYFYIPIDIQFDLNRYGSWSASLGEIEANEYFDVSYYEIGGREIPKLHLTSKGKRLAMQVIREKLNDVLDASECEDLSQTITDLSTRRADEISDDEHKKLLVDVEDRHRLLQKVNEMLVEYKDLYDSIDTIEEENMADVRLKALIEFNYHLMCYLKKKFSRLSDDAYDYGAYMLDYYFLHNASDMLPRLKDEFGRKERDGRCINKYYQYMINSAREYPFSIYNTDLKDLISDAS